MSYNQIVGLMLYTFLVAGYLLGSGKPYYAAALLGLIAPQVFFQVKTITFKMI